MHRRAGRSAGGLARAAVACAALVAMGSVAARAETAWVKDELRLNVRTGPGVQYRIVGVVKTGDRVDVIERGDGWTHVRASVGDGWIPEGFLQPEAPAGVRLAQSEAQTADFRQQVDSLSQRSAKLQSENQTLSSRDEEQRKKIETLTRENMELRAGARWPEWITGAGILAAGMAMGAILRAVTGRRARPRIKI